MKLDLDITRVKGMKEFLEYNLPNDKYVLMNSCWQSLLGIRENSDLDVLVSPDILPALEKIVEKPVSLMKYVHWYVQPFGSSPEAIIKNHSVCIDGVSFLKFGTYKKCLEVRVNAGRRKMSPSAIRLGKKSEKDLEAVKNMEDNGNGIPSIIS